MTTISLTKFAKDHNIAKSTLHDRCKLLGIHTSNGLDEDAQVQLKETLGLNKEVFEGELVDEENPAQELAVFDIQNGFKAKGALTFQGKNYEGLVSHIEDEVELSGTATANTLNSLFTGLCEADAQLGAAIGAKRLQNVLGTADKVFTDGLQNWASTQGLGK